MNVDSEQLEALLSRRLDEDLDAEEQALLRQAMADDPAAAASAKQYERLQRMLAVWRRLPADLNWNTLSKSVASRIEEDLAIEASARLDRAIDPAAEGPAPPIGPRLNPTAESFQATEELLRDWAGPLPEVDWDAYAARVSAAVRREATAGGQKAGRGRRWRVLAGWLAPMAAAASIALLLWWNRGANPTGLTNHRPAAPQVEVSLVVPESTGRVSIAFEESPAGPIDKAKPLPGGVAIAVGRPSLTGSSAPDEAYFY